MRVVVDTTIWSLALRRTSKQLNPRERELVLLLRSLVARGLAILPGMVRAELLSGIDTGRRLEEIADYLREFPDEPPDIEDYEDAGRCHNKAAAAGFAGSIVDMLICATAIRRDLPIFTEDSDFARYVTPLRLRLASREFLQRIIHQHDMLESNEE